MKKNLHGSTMEKISSPKGGFTLIEVLVSTGIMVIFLPFAASILLNSQLLASYSKHKIQAAYAAKQIIETQRQQAVLNGSIVSQVILDTRGQYNNYADYFYGTATVTVTPVAYSDNFHPTGMDHVVVQISWPEQILNAQVTMTETYAADIITNNPILN